MSVAVVIPFRAGCPHREAALECVIGWWRLACPEFDVLVADDGGEPFSRGASLNTGIEQSGADIIVAADGDILIGRAAAIEAVAMAAAQPGMVQPFDRLRWYDQQATATLLAAPHQAFTASAPRATYDWNADMSSTPLRGGMNVLSSDTWERMGGWLPALRGWGCEDNAAWAQAETLVAPPRRIAATVHHLYHPKPTSTPYAASDTIAANAATWRRVEAAAGNPDAMRQAVTALGGRFDAR